MNDGHPADGKEKKFSSFFKKLGRAKREEDVTEEIMDMVNESHEQGVLEENEAEMIGNIFEFGEKQVSDVMTHRNSIVALDDGITVREAFDRVMEENYSRYPVYNGDIDNITGVLHIRDLLKAYVEESNQNRTLGEVGKDILFKPYCIPETRNISPLFRQMQSDKIHMAIVVDEYGQTAGIVTMEDILEEIVGNILDEYDEEEEQIVTDADGSYIIEGQADLEDVEAKLGITFEAEDIDTLSGFMIYMFGRIPDDGESFDVEYKGFIFRTLEVRNRIILKVKVDKAVQDESC
ncbi:MAG: hemolysin family protein [Clostridia bacterium]|nr:hemolysin family protein [Clostridia bacterium]